MPHLAQARPIVVNAIWVLGCGVELRRLDFTGLQWLPINAASDVFPGCIMQLWLKT